jgi:hypothetical protein
LREEKVFQPNSHQTKAKKDSPRGYDPIGLSRRKIHSCPPIPRLIHHTPWLSSQTFSAGEPSQDLNIPNDSAAQAQFSTPRTRQAGVKGE